MKLITKALLSAFFVTFLSQSSFAQCEFTISQNGAATGCFQTTEEVVWTDVINNTATGNDLVKITSNGNWDGGAASTAFVYENGGITTTANETNKKRMIGLSSSNTDDGDSTIAYAIYLNSGSDLRIYENGNDRGDFGSYSTNDVFEVRVVEGVVKYYQNGDLLYISQVTPTLPLIVDVSIRDTGGTLEDVVINNISDGSFIATATSVGTGPTYQWKVNGLNVGTNSATYTNTGLSASDVVTCELTPGPGGCSMSLETSNSITIGTTSVLNFAEIYIEGTVASTACNRGEEEVVWNISSVDKVDVSGNDLNKIQSNGNWDGGASSFNTVSNNGFLQFSAAETNKKRMIGLSNTDVNSSNATIEFAIYLNSGSDLRIYESGSDIGDFGSYATNDIFQIRVEDGDVKYYQNGNLLRVSTVTPTLPLLVDVSIRDTDGTVTDAVVSNYNVGVFTATTTNAGASPSYQWKLNGGNVGSNSATYTNTSLSDGDVVSCEVTPDLDGCSSITVSTNSITNRVVSDPVGGIDFYIEGTVSSTACNTTDEEVVWQIGSLENVDASGNNLNKIQFNGTWNGGAASFNTVSDNGYLQFVASETNKKRMIGLSSSNTDATEGTIEYAIYLNSGSDLRIYESGSDRGDFGSYSTNDIFQIRIEGGEVVYYQNGTILYISTITPTLPMLVDVSIRDTDGTVTDALVSNYSTGVFTATATNVGASPTYQWKLNGGNVGSNSTTFTNTALTDGDVITCEVTPDVDGCSSTVYTSNSITNRPVADPTGGIDFYIEGTVSATACNTTDEQVIWQLGSLENVEVMTNNLEKIQSNGTWNGGAASFNTVSDNGYLQFVASETNKKRMIGLSTTNINSNFNTIQYAIYLNSGSDLRIYENGSDRGDFGSYATNDVFQIRVEDGDVKYYQNGNLLRIAPTAPVLPLLVDVSIRDTDGTVTNAIVSNYSTGVFTATAVDAGASPTYQWKLNGGNVGTNSSTYTNTSLVDNDVIICELTPDLDGCSTTIYTSNSITNKVQSDPASIDFYIEGTVASPACNTTDEEVVWQLGSLENVDASGNDLNKIQSNGNWDGGAASFNTVSDNGYLQFTATETDKKRVIGLSVSNTNESNSTIEYGIYLNSGSDLRINESGLDRGDFGSYATNDVFQIRIEGGEVSYYQNGNLLYLSTITPSSLPLLVDVSIRDTNGTVTDAVVSNYSTGVFTATATNVGASPTYQWKLNGGDVGSNSSTYTNTSLAENDVITCEIVPDLDGCGTTTYTSNSITNKQVTDQTSIDFYIEGSPSSDACSTIDEEVVWQLSSLENVEPSDNDLIKIQSNGSWNGGAASFNTVSEDGFLQFTAIETDKKRMIGLSSSNTNSNFNTIEFAIYLNSGSDLRIYENGSDRGDFGSYATNDVFQIRESGGTITYYQNGSLIYTSGNSPTLPLLVDVSIRDTNGTVTDAIVSNSHSGDFTATAIDAGSNPDYQWKINGIDVGPNSPIYSNSNLNDSDIVTCVLTPDLDGCATVTYTSNAMTYNDPGSPNTWIGTTSDWFTASNWSDGVPDQFSSVTIPSGTPNSPSISGNAETYDLTIDLGATLTITGSNSLTIYHDLTNNGTLNINTSTINFTGCGVDGKVNLASTLTFHNLVMNSDVDWEIESGTVQISNDLTFTKGVILQNGTLEFLNGSTSTGDNSDSYVDGPVKKIGSTDFDFPVGDSVIWAPIDLASIVGGSATTEFTAEYFFDPAPNPTDLPMSGLDRVSRLEYWDVTNNTTDVTSADLSLHWKDASRSFIEDIGSGDLVVTHYNSGMSEWEVLTTTLCGGSAIGVGGQGCITATFTSFSPIAFGSTGGANPLPVELLSFDGKLEQGRAILSWKTATETNNDYFTVERSYDLKSFDEVAIIEGAGASNEIIAYEFIDETPYLGRSYYRLKQTDFNGEFTFADKLITIDYVLYGGFKVKVYPNPTHGGLFYVDISAFPRDKDIRISLTDLSGREILSRLIRQEDLPVSILEIESGILSTGLYMISVQSGNLNDRQKVIISKDR